MSLGLCGCADSVSLNISGHIKAILQDEGCWVSTAQRLGEQDQGSTSPVNQTTVGGPVQKHFLESLVDISIQTSHSWTPTVCQALRHHAVSVLIVFGSA